MVLLNDLGQITHMNILVLGDKHTGKSSLISTFVNPRKSILCNNEIYSPTIEDSVLIQYIANNYQNDNNNNNINNSSSFNSFPSYANYPPNNNLYSSVYNTTAQPETLQEVLSSKTNEIDLESIFSEISNNTMDGSSYEFSVDTLNEISLDELSVSQSLYMERSEKDSKENCSTINLTITEIGGAEEFSSLLPSAIDKADAFMFVYDVGNEKSFHSIWDYFKKVVETKLERPKDIPMILVGTMVDTIVKYMASFRKREVTTEKGRLFSNLTNMPFFESSAKAPKVVFSCFKKLIYESQRIYMEYFENIYLKQQQKQQKQQQLEQDQEKQQEHEYNNIPSLTDSSEEEAIHSMKPINLNKSIKTNINTADLSTYSSSTINKNKGIKNSSKTRSSSLTPQQQLLKATLNQSESANLNNSSSSNSTESLLSSTSTLINSKSNIEKNHSIRKDIMLYNNNSGNTLIIEQKDASTSNITPSSKLNQPKRNSKLMNQIDDNSNVNTKRNSFNNNFNDEEENKNKNSFNLASLPSSIPVFNKDMTNNTSFNSSSSGSNSINSKQLLQTALRNSTIDRKSSGSSQHSNFSSFSQKNMPYNNQIMYLPQNMANTINGLNQYGNSQIINNLNKRISRSSLSDGDSTTANLISALSAITLDESNPLSPQLKSETLTLLKSLIEKEENELASTVVNEQNNSNNSIQNLQGAMANSNSTLNSSFTSQSFHEENDFSSLKQSNSINRKHLSDNSNILPSQLRHISSLSDLEFLKEKNLSQEQMLKEMYNNNTSPFKELKKLQNQIKIEEATNQINTNSHPFFMNSSLNSIPLSPELSHVSSQSSNSSISKNILQNLKRNSQLYNNTNEMSNLKQQYIQQNNIQNKAQYYHNLSNIIENQELNNNNSSSNNNSNNNSKPINTFNTSNGFGVQTNNMYNPKFDNTIPNNSFIQQSKEKLILQQQQQQQQQQQLQRQHNHYLKNSISTPNMHINSSMINNNLYKTMNNPHKNLSSVDTSNIPNINSNMASITNDELINNYEQLLNLYNVQIKRLQLQLLQQQKQMELSNMMDSPLLGQENLNLYSNPLNHTLNPNLYSMVDSLTNNVTLQQNKLFNNNFIDNGSGFLFNGNLGHSPTIGFGNQLNLGLATTSPSTLNNIPMNLAINTNNSKVTTVPNNLTSTSNMNYIPGIHNLGNINSTNRLNNSVIGSTVANGHSMASIMTNSNSFGTDVSTQPIFTSSFSIPSTNAATTTTNISDLNQQMNPLNTNSLKDKITDNFTNSSLSNLSDINASNIPSLDSNDQSISNAKNLFLEVIKDFDENEIQDIVQNTDIDNIIN
ncbi:hypothetical protein BCR36DRAFT_351265 [Piromyces finnis]|uniref:P-loop containing nucleoside triphosphate hydrolase protein n=1 Tax=Piromyces finnis TaxID=1754191 RepID=A0A1Y1VC33_9FUNG|nr:hypothetical protein BCR36DRAFT_351265 [Piromyces finnis]|eukprot:ORX51460.1 hypothetical protein BCR36DRAFT_351265 [Piromyces finnis]